MDNFRLYKSDYRIIGGYLFTVTFWLLYKFQVESYSWIEYLVDIPVAILQVLVLLFIVKNLIEYYFIKKGNLLVFIALGLISLWMVSFLSMLSGDLTDNGRISWKEYLPIGELIIANVQNSVSNISIPLMLISGKKYYEHQLNASKLINAQKELELKLLRNQFDPHFLYNSLNTIDALIDYSSKENIKKYISNLAKLYRHVVEMKDEEIVPLEEEIALGKNYLFLMKTQFEADYEVHFKLASLPEKKFLPNGAFLTVIENVIKHNKPKNGKSIVTNVIIEKDYVCVSNTKEKIEFFNKASSGTGLKNLEKRYRLLSDRSIQIQDTNLQFTVCLPLLSVVD
ncbi:MAG: histidine kinase [Bacteroidota bacterium]